jgi:hypothetical protein
VSSCLCQPASAREGRKRWPRPRARPCPELHYQVDPWRHGRRSPTTANHPRARSPPPPSPMLRYRSSQGCLLTMDKLPRCAGRERWSRSGGGGGGGIGRRRPPMAAEAADCGVVRRARVWASLVVVQPSVMLSSQGSSCLGRANTMGYKERPTLARRRRAQAGPLQNHRVGSCLCWAKVRALDWPMGLRPFGHLYTALKKFIKGAHISIFKLNNL